MRISDERIACYEEALRCWTTETDQLVCAATWNNLGEAYRQLATGDRGINLHQAIVCYEQALRLWTLTTDTFAYAATQNNLGIAYTQLPTAERAMNVREAIAHYHEALRVWTPKSDPLCYATVQHNLAYAHLGSGDHAATPGAGHRLLRRGAALADGGERAAEAHAT